MHTMTGPQSSYINVQKVFSDMQHHNQFSVCDAISATENEETLDLLTSKEMHNAIKGQHKWNVSNLNSIHASEQSASPSKNKMTMASTQHIGKMQIRRPTQYNFDKIN